MLRWLCCKLSLANSAPITTTPRRYTKALDSIKALRKERTAELKVAKAELEALKTDKERADGVRRAPQLFYSIHEIELTEFRLVVQIKRKVESFQRSLTEKEDRLEELDAEISKTTAQNKIFYEQATKFREILNKAEMLEDKQSTHKRHMDQLRMDMTEINGACMMLRSPLEEAPSLLTLKYLRNEQSPTTSYNVAKIVLRDT